MKQRHTRRREKMRACRESGVLQVKKGTFEMTQNRNKTDTVCQPQTVCLHAVDGGLRVAAFT